MSKRMSAFKAKNENAWYGLDNAANLFPAVSDDRNTNVFRLSCDLNENVDRVVLQKALDKSIKSFGYFQVVMHRGLFWFYLEKSEIEPKVKSESDRPCERIFYNSVKELLFQVSYFGNRINLEVFHAIADGNGALELLRTIVYYYILFTHSEDFGDSRPILDTYSPPSHKVEDSFDHHYDPNQKKSPFKSKAYAISGTVLAGNSVRIISGCVSVKQMLRLTKSKGVTITAYLSALIICSIYSGLVPRRSMHKTIAVNVPVDLRGHFPSETARNFFSVVDVGYNFGGGEADFDQVLESVSKQLSSSLDPVELARRINYNMSIQKNIFTGITPLFIKNIILRAAYNKGEASTTCALSNMGRITMPEMLSPYIGNFSCILNPTPQHRIKMCLSSFEDNLTLNFTSCIEETKVQRNFFRHLASQGLEITITGNGGADDETM